MGQFSLKVFRQNVCNSNCYLTLNANNVIPKMWLLSLEFLTNLYFHLIFLNTPNVFWVTDLWYNIIIFYLNNYIFNLSFAKGDIYTELQWRRRS